MRYPLIHILSFLLFSGFYLYFFAIPQRYEWITWTLYTHPAWFLCFFYSFVNLQLGGGGGGRWFGVSMRIVKQADERMRPRHAGSSKSHCFRFGSAILRDQVGSWLTLPLHLFATLILPYAAAVASRAETKK
jgi:hypothetical protein